MLIRTLYFEQASIIAAVVCSLIAAGFLKGIIGVGMPVVALPLLSLFIDVKSAAMLLSMPLIFSNLPQALEGGKTGWCLMQLMPVILGMIPGLGNLKQLADNKPDEKQMGRVEAIICSMTPEERRNDRIINGSRRKRIARGSGTSVEEVNRLLKQFTEMKKVLQMIGQSGTPGMKGMKGMPKIPPGALRGAQGGGFAPPGARKRKKGGPWGLIKTR